MKVPAILAVMMSCAVLAACNSAETPPADTGAFGTGAAGTGADGTSIDDPATNDRNTGMDTTLQPSPEINPDTGTFSTEPNTMPGEPGASPDVDLNDPGAWSGSDEDTMPEQPLN